MLPMGNFRLPQGRRFSNSRPECLSRRGPEVEYEWQIENFSMCPQAKGQALESTSFTVDSLDQSEFKLILYPRGQEDGVENVACFLECLNEPDCNINVVITVLGTNKSATVTKTKERFTLSNGERIGFELLSDRQELVTKEPEFLPDDVFTIRCVLTPEYRAPFASDQDFLDLSREFSSLLESGDFSDFVIRGSEGEKYRVHKIIISMRSCHLAKELGLLDEKPKRQGNICDMSPAVLKAVLHYLYSGNLRHNLTPDVLSEVYEAAKRYEMDDLQREIFPLETRTIASTIVKVDRRIISWALKNFKSRMDAGDWPIRTFVDLTHGIFVISFSVIIGSDNEPLVQIDVYSQSLIVEGYVLVKCDVLVDHGEGRPNSGLCSAEHFFDNSNAETRTFSMTGDHNILYDRTSPRKYPETVTLVFRLLLSTTGSSSECRRVEVNSKLVAPNPVFNRSHQRLSSDLDMVFRDTINRLDHDVNWDPVTFSDLRISTSSDTKFRAHRCILAARSSRLREMFMKHGIEEKVTSMHISIDRNEHVKDFLRYIYSGKIIDLNLDMDLNQALRAYFAATDYQIPTLIKRYSQILKTKITIFDMDRIMAIAEEDSDDNLFSVVQEYILTNRERVLSSALWEDFADLRPHLAKRVLGELPEAESRFLYN